MSNNCCQLCLSNIDDELSYGKLFRGDDITVHHFCLVSIFNLKKKLQNLCKKS